MTKRAILTGFALAMLVALGGHFNDVYMQQTYMVGNYLPISVIGFLLFLVLVVNPLLYRMRPRWKLRAGELAVIAALPLAVCVVPGSGFLRTFSPMMVLPRHYEQMNPSWRQNEVLSYVPGRLLAGGAEQDEEEVVGGFLEGKGGEGKHIGLGAIPWKAWASPIKAWIPLFLVLMLGLVGLSLVVHRQWTTHEHLVYPVAEFVRLVTERSEGSAYPAALRSRVFWFGFVPVLAIHIVNGLHAWHPTFIRIPHHVDLQPVAAEFPRLGRALSIGYARIYFAVLAFAYFLPSDITLSLGLARPLAGLFSFLLVTYGVSATSVWIGAGEIQGLLFGAYTGLFVLVLYSGRKYYGRVLLAAFGVAREDRPEASAVWGCRIFLVSGAVCIFLLTGMGLAWPLAIVLSLVMTLLFLCMTRVCAETGLFFLQPQWMVVGILVGLFGTSAIGPRMLAVCMLASIVLSCDPREAMMPFIANALRIAENAGIARGRLAAGMSGTLVIGLLAGLVLVLWLQYDRGVGRVDGWATRAVPTQGFQFLDNEIQKLKADGMLEPACRATGIERLRLVRAKKSFAAFMGIGLLLFATCALLRLRFHKWPLHPVLFLVWFTWPVFHLGPSFLIGWAVKSLVVKIGGGSTYQKIKPVMVGLIAGDLTGGLVFMVAGALYYAATGFAPVRFAIFPR